MVQNTIYAPIFTNDKEIEHTIFVLKSFHRIVPSLLFTPIIPIQNQKSAQIFQHEFPNTPFIFRRTGTERGAIINALTEEIKEKKWVLWLSSKHFPIMANRNFDFIKLTRRILLGEFDRYQSIKLSNWHEPTSTPHLTPHFNGGEYFNLIQHTNSGYFLPQFIKAPFLITALGRLKLAIEGRGQSPDIMGAFNYAEARAFYPPYSLMKFEETVAGGKVTLNYELRRRRKGLRATPTDKVTGKTCCYLSTNIKCSNHFWNRSGPRKKQALSPVQTGVPFKVVSFGGAGSKMLCEAIYRDCGITDIKTLVEAHSHARLPPINTLRDQKTIYLLCDPRDAVVSFFNRRHRRHEGHGFKEISDQSKGNANSLKEHWTLQHQKHLQAEPAGLQASWDLPGYLEQSYDLFRLEEHVDGWMYANLDSPVVFVKYEQLWENKDQIAAHLGLNELVLPDRKKRTSDWRALPEPQKSSLNCIYGEFAERINRLPAAFFMLRGSCFTLDGKRQIRPDRI